MNKKIKGFTLIELLVVIAIISLLSTTVMASLNQARQKSRDAKRISDMKTIQTALEIYYNDNNGYPITGWRSQCAGWGGYINPDNVIPGLAPTYIGKVPSDPMMVKNSNINCYLYASYDNGASYKIMDYNCADCNISSAPSFKDPARNGGSSQCPSTEPTPTWAIWSSPTAMCW